MNTHNEPLLLPLPEPVEVVHLSLHPFQPLKPYVCYRMGVRQSDSMMEAYTRQAENTSVFVMYLLRGKRRQPSKVTEMAIELVDSNATLSTVYLLEFSSLPSSSHPSFQIFRKLIQTIFGKSKVIITWNDQYADLHRLFRLMYLFRKSKLRATFVPIHDRFKECYQNLFPHEYQCFSLTNSASTVGPCTCRHRLFTSITYQWSISQAIEHVFTETLNSSVTSSKELDPQQFFISGSDQIVESVGYCLAVSKLWTSIRLNCTQE